MTKWAATLVVVMAIPGTLWWAGPAAAEPSTNDEVCGAFNMGESSEQIIERLRRNDARYNYWRARDSTVWPILEGDCG